MIDDLQDIENEENNEQDDSSNNDEESEIEDSDEKEDRQFQKNEDLIMDNKNEKKLQSTFIEFDKSKEDDSDEDDFLWNKAGRERRKEERKRRKLVDDESEERSVVNKFSDGEKEEVQLVGDIASLLSTDDNTLCDSDEGFENGLPYTTVLKKGRIENESKMSEDCRKSHLGLKKIKKSIAEISQINRLVCVIFD
jgi:hypothetical protein